MLYVHNVDVESGFSVQNNILTKKRNALSFETQNMLLKQNIEEKMLEVINTSKGALTFEDVKQEEKYSL